MSDKGHITKLARIIADRRTDPPHMTGSTTAGGADIRTRQDRLPMPIGTPGQVLKVVTDGGDEIPSWEDEFVYTNEQAQDAVGGILTDTSSIDLVYDDALNTITASVILEWLQDTVAAILTGGTHTNLTATYQDATGVVDLAASGGGSYTDEQVRDVIGTALVAGNNIDITVNDAGDSITIDVESLTSADVTDFSEAAQDAVAAIVDNTSSTTWTYTDATPRLAVDVNDEYVHDTVAALLQAGSGVSLAYNDGADTLTISADVGGTLGQMNLPRWVTGRYYDVTSAVAASFSSGTYATGTLIAVLQYVPNTNTVDRIGVGVTSAAVAGRLARLGIYAMGADGNPGALVLDAGTVTIDATGTREITIGQSLTGGNWYWLAVTFDGGTGTLYRAIPSGGPVGYAGLNSNNNDAFAVDRAFTYGALPDPFGTPSIRTGHVPRIGVRAG